MGWDLRLGREIVGDGKETITDAKSVRCYDVIFHYLIFNEISLTGIFVFMHLSLALKHLLTSQKINQLH